MLAITIVLALVLFTDGYDVTGAAGRPLDGMLDVPNLFGQPGAFVAGILALLIGDAAHLIYAVALIWAIKLFTPFPFGRIFTRLIGMLLLVLASAGLLHINVVQGFSNTQPGGVFGAFIAEQILQPWFGLVGANVLGSVVLLIGLLLATDFLFIHFFVIFHRVFRFFFKGVWVILRKLSRGVLWLFESQPSRTSAQKTSRREDEVDSDGHTDDLPFPAVSKRKTLLDIIAGMFSFLRPQVSSRVRAPHSNEQYPQDENPTEDFAGQNSGASGTVKTREGRTLRPAGAPDSGNGHTEVPFGDIPVVDSSDAQPGSSRDKIKQGELFGEAPAGEEGSASAAAKGVAHSQKDGDPPEDVDEGDCMVSLRHEGVAAKSVTSKPGGPRLRRKPVADDELPDDYEYPEKYTRPPIEIFKPAERHIIPNLSEKMGKMADRLEETLRTFNLEAKVTDVTRGPTVTRFELEPAPGMKVSRFLGLRDDIALTLKAKGVRIEAPIPGKGRVGIEISNEERDPVVIRDLLEHPVFQERGAGLDLALGKGIAGDVCIADLTRMPHLLVAGATGAGKTVCIKALLASLLYHHTPDELQLMLVDPKMVELSIFNDIPHLITPVVTDPKKAATALQWLITEMEERYRLFRDLRVRNIDVYNNSVENGEIEMEGGKESRKSQSLNVVRKLPYIVCIIDELADLMILARADVEEAIMRLAQLARAVGIHLIIATQRPSVDVLTGVIKANFPARISFQVSSRVDSRCILDEIGAENLVGLGDMLFMPAGQKPVRIQGAFVSDAEMLSLIAYLKRQAPPQYRDEIANYGKSKDSSPEIDQEDDPKLDEAIRVVLETRQASISMVQRRLRVGYTRAARLIDMMELKGIVGPHTGSKARDILVNPSDNAGNGMDFSDEEDVPEDDEPEEDHLEEDETE